MLKKLFNSVFRASSNSSPSGTSSINRQRMIRQAQTNIAYQQSQNPEFDRNETFEILPEDFELSGPYRSDNLTVFLIHGTDKLQHDNLLTLEQALKAKKVVVLETGKVSSLQIKNLCEEPIFLQSGEIVRGGHQDRTLQFDMILPAGKEASLPTLCVEQGRWGQRKNEPTRNFCSSVNYAAGKRMKMAAKHTNNQNEVWSNVEAYQKQYSKSAGFDSRSLESVSSYELTMESEPVKKESEKYIKDLAHIIDQHNDVIGFAFGINGELNCADLYASNKLFKQLWSKLLKSTAAEALAERGKTSYPELSKKSVLQFLQNAQNSPARRKFVAEESVMLEQESADSLLYRTQWCNPRAGNNFVHCNFLAK